MMKLSVLSYANALNKEYQKYPELSAAQMLVRTIPAESVKTSCHPGVKMGTGKFNVGGNLAIY